jgi:hypothetical protein
MMMRLSLALLLALAAFAQKQEFTLSADGKWFDTGVEVKSGDTLNFTAEGEIQWMTGNSGPAGIQRRWKDLMRAFLMNEAPRGAVVGKVGESAAVRPFLVGAQAAIHPPINGRLYLAVNGPSGESGRGSLKVNMERVEGAVDQGPPPAELLRSLTKVTQTQLNTVPLRVQGQDGTPGDRTNFLIVGTEKKVTEALAAAGWLVVDREKKDTILRGLMLTLSKQAYTTLPMSELMLFERVQDYGYAQGDPLRVVAARHHFRIWKAPFEAGGMPVWVGAGTHDVGFDRDKRNGKITHKIDPNTDGERDYIGESLKQTGRTVLLEYITPKDPITRANTAHGQEFTSDGRTLVIYMKPDVNDQSSSFGNMFCSVLTQRNPDAGEWGQCTDWWDDGGRGDLKLAALPTNYRVLIVPGFFSSCFPDSPAYMEGQDALKPAGVQIDLLEASNNSSEENAEVIADFIRNAAKSETKPFLLIGYSKGTPDIQVALAKYPEIRKHVAAFVSVAGASGGSPVAEAALSQAGKYMRNFSFGNCKGDLTRGFESLRVSVRSAFLAAHPKPYVPSYSIIAASDKDNTSKSLAQTWMVLKAYSEQQDGQLLRKDAIVPFSRYLGAARSDHFALALPFDKAKDSMTRGQMNMTRYPRAALLESILRFVAQDLKR